MFKKIGVWARIICMHVRCGAIVYNIKKRKKIKRKSIALSEVPIVPLY